MIVLSLFDGCSCAQVALERAGIKVDKYYSSEIDKWAIQITQKNYPGTIQLGDVNDWTKWNIEQPDLIIGGSPCQGFSNVGTKQNFNDPRSKLFFQFYNIVQHYKPKFYFLENVKMKKDYHKIITDYMNVEPIEINSKLLSAQNRLRMYWFNWKIKEPINKKIYLEDILLDYIDEKYYLSVREIAYMNRAVKDGRTHWDFMHHSDSECEKSHVVPANFYKGVPYNVLIDRRNNNCFRYDCQFILDKECWCDYGDSYQETYNPIGSIRKFHPIECERLQTLPDNYTEGVSSTQRYKMLGNGFTVDVIAHILRYIKNETM